MGRPRRCSFPDWPELFGLVMIEAMACGTPVIAYPRGAVPEVLEDGVTGWMVEGIEEAVQAVERVPLLSRARCRQVFEERFPPPAWSTTMSSSRQVLHRGPIVRRHERSAAREETRSKGVRSAHALVGAWTHHRCAEQACTDRPHAALLPLALQHGSGDQTS